jgi:flagellar biosynthesis anti-sigma factor FlgM
MDHFKKPHPGDSPETGPDDNPPASPAGTISPQASLTSPSLARDDEALDDVRLEKIAKIKKALEDGTYHVSNEEVARKLIEHMLEPKK